MQFLQARDWEYPPYLQNFLGSPGERHVENLKVGDAFVLLALFTLVLT